MRDSLRKRWIVATPIALLLALAAAWAIWYFHELSYRATAWIHTKRYQPYIAFGLGAGDPAGFGGDPVGYIQTQGQLIRSPLVLAPLLSRPEIAGMAEVKDQKAPLDWLASRLEVRFDGHTQYGTVSFVGPDPNHAKAIVDAVVEEYFRVVNEQDTTRFQDLLTLLDKEHEQHARDVQLRREKVGALFQAAVAKDPSSPPPAAGTTINVGQDPLRELQTRLVTTEVDRRIVEVQIAALNESASREEVTVSSADVANALREHPEVQTAVDRLAVHQEKLRAYENSLKDAAKDPGYVVLKEQFETDQKALDKLREDLMPTIQEELASAAEKHREQQLAYMDGRLKALKLFEQTLKEQYAERLDDLTESAGDTWELEYERAELDREEAVFDRIAERLVELRTEQRAPGVVELARAADRPERPIESGPWKWIILGVLGALGFPFGLAVGLEYLARRVADAQQLQQRSQLPVVGEVSRLPVRTRWSSAKVERELSLFRESIDSLRTYLSLSEPLCDMQVLAITSAAKGEGKTTVAVQLAFSLAHASGAPTLLVDGDVRSPQIHKMFDLPASPGLTSVLVGECRLDEAVNTSWNKRVHILPAGKLRGRSPHKLVGNGALKSLLNELRSTYRYIVIDTAPILAASEALVFAKVADGSLVCTMRDVSRVDQVNVTLERLWAANANPIGTVLNGVPTSSYSYRYGKYPYNTISVGSDGNGDGS